MSMSAGDRTVSLTSVANDTEFVTYQGKLYAVKRATIAESASGDNSVVAAVASKALLLLAFYFTGAGAVNAKWRSGTTDISGLTYIGSAGQGVSCAYVPGGWCKTAVGEALNLNLSAAVAVGGAAVYCEVDA